MKLCGPVRVVRAPAVRGEWGAGRVGGVGGVGAPGQCGRLPWYDGGAADRRGRAMMAIGRDGLGGRRKTRAARMVRGGLALILLSGALATGACTLPYEARGHDLEAEILAAVRAGIAEAFDLTPLHAAALNNASPSEITALIEGGADPGARVFGDNTALHIAARANTNPSVIAVLIESGADPGARTVFGETPLHAAAEMNSNPAVIAALIEAGADPAARNEDGATPLHTAAAWNSNPSVIKALLESGADPSARDAAGNTPFDYAKENGALKGTDAYWLLSDGRFE